MESPTEPRPPDGVLSGALVAYLQLFRIPNLFTAVSNVTMGCLFVRVSLAPLRLYVCLLAGSALLYTSGMVLNDLYDLAADTKARPHRPLPSGRIAVSAARRLGYGMLICGLAWGWLAGYVSPDPNVVAWHSGLVASALALAILLYNWGLKASPAGPLLMGACRMLNVLLGMSVGGALDPKAWHFLGFDAAQWLVAGGIGTFIVGVTCFARSEARISSRRGLVAAVGVMIVGLSMLAVFPNYGAFGAGARSLTMHPPMVWPVLIFVLGFSIVRRCGVAIVTPQPQRVQLAVKQCILSLIVFDAAICLGVRSPMWWSLGILALMVPTLWLGRWVYST